ncbi:MAG TPA: SAM-dependent methyltransferase [Candidatus Angelobacter sp.]|nr:SAM-dependent methyltransferase [Candidatus Angelobacter sp.]
MFDEQLIVIGTGIRTIGQMTMESIAWIKRANKVLYIISDPVAEELIKTFNPEGAESLHPHYGEGKPRIQSYNEMIEKTLAYIREGKVVCFAAYGHPGVFAYPTHESVRRARAEGFKARMLPGVSAEDCLFADLNIDPAMAGCQTYEATDFLLNGRIFDPSSHVILWQIGVLGDLTFKPNGYDIKGMPELLQKLYSQYPPHHPVVIYEAALYPGVEPLIRQVPLFMLPNAGISPISTLYIPPAVPARTNWSLIQHLGIYSSYAAPVPAPPPPGASMQAPPPINTEPEKHFSTAAAADGAEV